MVVVVVVVVSVPKAAASLLVWWSHSRKSNAMRDAIFLKPMLVPEMRLKRTPLSDKRGNLHTSISHCTKESVLGSPCTHQSTNLSRCS